MTDTIDSLETTLRSEFPGDVFIENTAPYFEERRGYFHGHGVVLAPRSTETVAAIVSFCAKHSVPVIPYGGGTGLVAGQLTQSGPPPVVLTLERMNKIRDIWPDENVMVVEAGAILADVQRAAEEESRLFPLSLASEGSARIGGLLATNAGGVNVIRYGNARALCLGLEVVMPDGTIWHGLSRLRKDNTGYDLRDLMIGSEGTLGIITAAALKLFPRPAETGVAMFQVASPKAALELLTLTSDIAGEGVSAFELIEGQGFHFLKAAGIDHHPPFAEPPEWCVLIELGLSAGQSPEPVFETLFEKGMERGLLDDGVIAQTLQQRQDLWNIREFIPEANKHVGAIASHDVSLPLSHIPAFIDDARVAMAKLGPYRINCFGHLGDGNLHYNIFPPEGQTKDAFRDSATQISRTVHDMVMGYDGSFSAEHGVGRLKVDDLERYGDPVKLASMRAIKKALDPNGIMNPGAVLRV